MESRSCEGGPSSPCSSRRTPAKGVDLLPHPAHDVTQSRRAGCPGRHARWVPPSMEVTADRTAVSAEARCPLDRDGCRHRKRKPSSRKVHAVALLLTPRTSVLGKLVEDRRPRVCQRPSGR